MVQSFALRTRSVVIVLFGVVLALVMVLTSSPATAAAPDDIDRRSSPSLHITDAPLLGKTGAVPATASGDLLDGGVALDATGYRVVCKGSVEYAHLSRGAGGAVSKIRITCTGSGLSSVNVRVQGLLQFARSSSPNNTNVNFVQRASSDQWQRVIVNGSAVTFYLPEVGGNGGRGTGFWRSTGTWYFKHPGGDSTVGSDTVTVFKTI
ncbi:hypothetical protein MF406_12685 [Georgenia sp. TF02-10]|uniref:hypothetical protein n=1 Tax=Georgenia sp. TF02-10 TaxID=2917725 RepID=UPI001FA77777|nr:hypothetical protein [Georgenia sp. TF02-10]UNX53830.1 hypothetical protein MF406_12685 [Georgenia sp. TF02-10]